MADRNDSFLREVDEDVRRDQLLQLWEKYGTLVVAGVLALFVAIGGYKWWEAHKITNLERAGAQFETASRLAAEGKGDEAVKAFSDLATSAPGGYRTLARLRLAAEQAKAGRAAEALVAYEALAADSSVEELLRDFATLKAAMLRLDQADWTEMKNRLTPILDDKRPWHAPARELLGLAAMKAGQTEEATKLFEQLLGDRATTSSLSRRAQEMLSVLNDAAAAKSGAGAQTKPGDAGASAGAAVKGSEPGAKK
ncbi:MAG: tetratricopeptide repeat protein [Hyphomicrobiaceae bacterium]